MKVEGSFPGRQNRIFFFFRQRSKKRHLSLKERCKECSLFRAKNQTRLRISPRRRVTKLCLSWSKNDSLWSVCCKNDIYGQQTSFSNDSTIVEVLSPGLAAPETHLDGWLCHAKSYGVWGVWADPRVMVRAGRNSSRGHAISSVTKRQYEMADQRKFRSDRPGSIVAHGGGKLSQWFSPPFDSKRRSFLLFLFKDKEKKGFCGAR